MVDALYQAQKHRGTEGFGFFDQTRTRLKRATKERKILSQLKNTPSSSILFHHRWPTSTQNVKNACHPFSTRDFFDTNYVLIHNGHISNSYELQADHFEDYGIEYYSTQQDGTFNDSESLLWDVALYLEGKQEKLNAYGNIAFIVLAIPKDKRKPTKLHFGRNVQPLNMLMNETMLLLASELDGDPIDTHKLYTYNYKSKKLTTTELNIPANSPFVPSVSTPYSSTYDDNEFSDVLGWGDDYDTYEPYWENGRKFWRPAGSTTIYDAADLDFPMPHTNHVALKHGRSSLDDCLALLPTNEDYTWSGVTGEDMEELVYERPDGGLINVKSTVLERLDSYLEAVDGNYQKAFELMQYDLDEYQTQLIEDESLELVPDLDLAIECDIVTIAQYTLTGNSGWQTSYSRDIAYDDIATQATMGFLQSQRRARLTAGAV